MSKQASVPQQTQDWATVNIGKSTKTPLSQQIRNGTVKRDIVEKQGAAKNTQSSAEINARKLEENEIGHHPTPSHSLAIQIQQARTAKKMTQDQLNTACNFPKGTVSLYENGKAIVNNTQLQTMSKQLGVTLKKNA